MTEPSAAEIREAYARALEQIDQLRRQRDEALTRIAQLTAALTVAADMYCDFDCKDCYNARMAASAALVKDLIIAKGRSRMSEPSAAEIRAAYARALEQIAQLQQQREEERTQDMLHIESLNEKIQDMLAGAPLAPTHVAAKADHHARTEAIIGRLRQAARWPDERRSSLMSDAAAALYDLLAALDVAEEAERGIIVCPMCKYEPA